MSEIKISLTSKKFCCEFGIKEKLTFIRGDSGVGKTEFTKRVSSKTTANTINVSNGFNLNVLTKDVFETVYNNAMKHKNKTEKTRAQDETKFLAKYWSNEDNFPLQDNTIFIIDDEDFVKSHVFSVLFKCDRSNYYIIINRSNLPNLSYSADEVYNFISDGKNHYLERYFNYKEDAAIEHVDNVFVEGIGSDFIFFSRLFSNSNVFNPTSFSGVNGGGKDNLIAALMRNLSTFSRKRTLLIIDFAGFGSTIGDLTNLILDNDLHMVIARNYLSFEYFLLKSNFIHDEIDKYILENRLKFYSLEDLCTQRLITLTKDTVYSYDKGKDSFSTCFYLDCCSDPSNLNSCKLKKSKFSRNKIVKMIENTEFEYFLGYR